MRDTSRLKRYRVGSEIEVWTRTCEGTVSLRAKGDCEEYGSSKVMVARQWKGLHSVGVTNGYVTLPDMSDVLKSSFSQGVEECIFACLRTPIGSPKRIWNVYYVSADRELLGL